MLFRSPSIHALCLKSRDVRHRAWIDGRCGRKDRIRSRSSEGRERMVVLEVEEEDVMVTRKRWRWWAYVE